MPRRRYSLVVPFLALVAAALGLGPRVAAQSEARFPPASPESQGMSSEALAQLVAEVKDLEAKEMFVGAELVIIKNRHLVLQETFGSMDRDADRAWQPNTICNIRSMSKPFTGAAIQILIDRGLVKLDDSISNYLPAFDNDTLRPITVSHLLSHQSGLPLTAITTAIDQFEDLQSLVASLEGAELRFAPGTDFWYSDAGTDTLGAIIQKVSGVTLDEFVDQEFIRPLGMTDSFYGIHDDEARFERTADLYMGGPNAWTRIWKPADGALYPYAWGSQTIFSTPIDYARFLCMWMDEGRGADGTRILSPEAVKRTLTPAAPMKMLGSDARFPTDFTGLETYYGQMSVLHVSSRDVEANGAANVEPTIIGHSGSDGTIAWAWPDRDLLILFFTQSRGGSAVLRLEDPINRLILHPELQAAASNVPEGLKPFLGTYIANFATYENEEFQMLYKNGKLALDIPSQMVFELNEPDEEGRRAFAIAPDRIFVTFERDADGDVTLLKVHQGGEVFDVPRKGTALAAEQARRPVVDAEKLQPFLGRYKIPGVEALVTVYLDGETLCVKPSTQDVVLHLRATDEPNTFEVKQAPGVRLRFNADESGAIISLTQIAGETTTDMPRMEDEQSDGGVESA